MDRIKERLASLRAEADQNAERADAAEAKNKQYEQQLLEKEQDVLSLNRRLAVLEEEVEKAEGKIQESKVALDAASSSSMTSEGLSRKVQLLEEELDAAEKNVKETVEKLRQVDVKAEHFERQLQRAEQERDAWEKKYEEAEDKLRKSKAELDDLVQSMGSL